MFGIPLIEWIGYLASILIAISMFMKDIVKLRFINLVGSLLFAFYGFREDMSCRISFEAACFRRFGLI